MNLTVNPEAEFGQRMLAVFGVAEVGDGDGVLLLSRWFLSMMMRMGAEPLLLFTVLGTVAVACRISMALRV